MAQDESEVIREELAELNDDLMLYHDQYARLMPPAAAMELRKIIAQPQDHCPMCGNRCYQLNAVTGVCCICTMAVAKV